MKFTFKLVFAVGILFTVACSVHGQSQFGVYVAPTVTSQLRQLSDWDRNQGLRYDVGFNYKYYLGRFALGAGLDLSSMGFNTRVNVFDNTGNSLGTEVGKFKRTFIEIPVCFTYTLREKEKSRIAFESSLINQFRIQETYVIPVGEIKTGTISFSELREDGWNIYNLAIRMAFSYYRNINSKYGIELAPFVKTSVLKMNSVYDSSLGLRIGIGFTK